MSEVQEALTAALALDLSLPRGDAQTVITACQGEGG